MGGIALGAHGSRRRLLWASGIATPVPALAGALQQLIGPLVYTDTSRRSFMLITAKRDELLAQWSDVDTVISRNDQTLAGPTLRTIPETHA